MKRLIVNADDLGLTKGINRAVVEGHLHGIITSASLLANGAAFGSAVALARQQTPLGIGVHLNLTQGRPVAASSRVPSLLNPQGIFFSGPLNQIKRLLTGHATLSDVEIELRAQIEKVQRAGIRITHLDGHQHVHLLPSVFDVAIRLAKEFGIGAIRCAVERSVEVLPLMGRNGRWSTVLFKQFLTGRALTVLSSSLRKKVYRARLRCPTHFYGVTQTGFLDAAALERIIRHLPRGTSELMCHPGYVDADLSVIPTRLLKQRERELQALTRPEIKRLIQERAVQLINYRDLTEAS
jgi:hopanoid biosynthesis associated protein HpnK